MDNRCIHPLFEKTDYNAALEYLTNRVEDGIADIGFDMSSIFEEDGFIDEEKIGAFDILKNTVLKSILESAYGVNVVKMANYAIVEDIFIKKYYKSILSYMDTIGLDAYYVKIYPHSIIPALISNRSKSPNFKPMNLWDPNKEWNLMDMESTNIEKNILNPINHFYHISMIIKDVDNDDFINALYKNSPISLKNRIKRERSKGNKINVCVKLLPFDSYDKIFDFVNILHKYM